MTTPLPDVQARFHAYIINDGPVPVDITRSTEKASAENLLSIYFNGYRLCMLEALEDEFPALKVLLGDKKFEALGREYIAQNPSRHYSIRWFGKAFPDFIADTAPWRERTELGELAAWEMVLGLASDAADAEPIEAAAFGAIAPEEWSGLTFRFHPSLSLLPLSWTVPAFRQAVDDEETEPAAPELLDAPVAWAVWREGTTILYRSLADNELDTLEAAKNGTSFGSLCEALSETQGDNAAETAGGFLRTWVEQGWINGIES